MYKQKLNDLFSEISHAGDIEVHSFILRPPLSSEELDKLFHEHKLPSALMLFYGQMNGCQLSYTFKSNTDFKKEEFGYYDHEFPLMWPNENYWHLDGCINILPIDFICRNNWKDYIWFDSKNDVEMQYKDQLIKQSDFEKRIKPVDVFSKHSIAVIFPVGEESDILLSTDHNASYTDYESVKFDEYIDAVIYTNGIIDKRKEVFIHR
jgi:hypothetical protein